MSDIDGIALEVVKAIGNIDPDKLPGGRTQAIAQAQILVRDAIEKQLEQAQARVAELEGQFHVKQLASLMRGLEVKPGFGSMPPEGFYALGRAIADQAKAATEPAILRKQAEAVGVIADKLEGMNLMRPDEFLRSSAQRLRQQADEAERAGGEHG